MPTAWQLLMNKLKPNPQPKILNPLKAKIGSSVELDVLDWRGRIFFVEAIRQIDRRVSGQDYPFVDYDLVFRSVDGPDEKVVLRLICAPGATLVQNSCVLLRKYDAFRHNKDFLKLLDDPEFVTEDNGKETGRYWRINDTKTPYHCSVKKLDQEENLWNHDFQLWDYWRERPDEAGQPTKEFLFIEMEEDNGYFTIWIGEEINLNLVTIL